MGLLDDSLPNLTLSAIDCQYDVRFLNKEKNSYQIQIYDNYWKEQINQYGILCKYYEYNYKLSSHDFLYGEEPTAKYLEPIELTILVNMSNDSKILSKFGIAADADIVAYIPITTFHTLFGNDKEPKSKDLIELYEYGQGRPNGRGSEVFELTFRDDQILNETNALMGHYVWCVKGKRFDFSYEENAKREDKMDQVYDNSFEGLLSAFNQPQTVDKTYSDNVETKSKEIFDYESKGIDTSVYGSYDS